MNNTKNTLIAALALIGIFSFSSVAHAQSTPTPTSTATSSGATTVSDELANARAIHWPVIEAKSAFVYNPVTNTVLYEKNADIQRSTASLLKIMTAVTADNILDANPKLALKPLSVVSMKDEAPADFALQAKSAWSPESLVQIMLLGSSNKAAETLASGLLPRSSFISLMNFNAKRMGLTKTYFRNPSGLTLPAKATSTAGRLDVAAGVSTAREIAKLMWTAIAENPGLMDITRAESITITNPLAKTTKGASAMTVIDNTNKALKNFPIMFSKTGFTENSGGNVAVVMQKDERSYPYIIVVLGSTQDKRFDDLAKLASTTLQLISLTNMTASTSGMMAAR